MRAMQWIFLWLTTKNKIEQKIQFSQFEEIDDEFGREGGLAWGVFENMQNILFRACVFSREKKNLVGKMRVHSVKPYR